MSDLAERSAQIAAFASLGSLTVTQEISGRLRQSFPDFDEEVVAEETLCFVSAVTTHCILSSANDGSGSGSVGSGSAAALRDLPYSFRDYVIGQMILAPDANVAEELSLQIGERLSKKIRFYESQLGDGLRPTIEKGLDNLSVLWMGRISQPGQAESPEERVRQLNIVDLLLRHMTLVTSFTTHASS